MTRDEAVLRLEVLKDFSQNNELKNMHEAIDMAIEALSCSGEPNRSEPLTNKEQRIFLAAIGRERKVCKQADKECRDCREPYEDSFVSVCNEIERKVKGALWI